MDALVYWLARLICLPLELLPLPAVAWLGRRGGGLAYWLDGRHRRVALQNLTAAFGEEMSPAEINAVARENFRRIGENYACAVRTSRMSAAEIQQILALAVDGKVLIMARETAAPTSRVVAIGHFGNFELYARLNTIIPDIKMATTYRGLRQPGLDRLLKRWRARSGCLFFERRTGAAALKEAMTQKKGLWLGLLADQHAGDKGLRLPFLGRDCSASAAPAVFALRYHCPLYTAICYRVAPGRWQIEVGAEIPTHVNGEARSLEDITLDIQRALEVAVRRDPANWFWVHNRWKPARRAKSAVAPEGSSL